MNSAVLAAGQSFEGRYEILSVLGHGGVGIVYKARHLELQKVHAIKTLKPQALLDDTDFLRFRQEAITASDLNHPNIITIHDFGKSTDGCVYLVMEFLDGYSLQDILKDTEHIDLDTFLEIFIQVCDALQHAHKKGIIHRDIKPSNIMLVQNDEGRILAKIVDFGLAKFTSPDAQQHLTQTGTVVGTPLYMSPEQCSGLDLDHRSDIFSVGCMMYAALTGRIPLKGDSALNTIYKHIIEPPEPFSQCAPELGIPAALERAVMKALEKKPEARQQSMNELRTEITNAIAGAGTNHSGLHGTRTMANASVQNPRMANAQAPNPSMLQSTLHDSLRSQQAPKDPSIARSAALMSDSGLAHSLSRAAGDESIRPAPAAPNTVRRLTKSELPEPSQQANDVHPAMKTAIAVTLGLAIFSMAGWWLSQNAPKPETSAAPHTVIATTSDHSGTADKLAAQAPRQTNPAGGSGAARREQATAAEHKQAPAAPQKEHHRKPQLASATAGATNAGANTSASASSPSQATVELNLERKEEVSFINSAKLAMENKDYDGAESAFEALLQTQKVESHGRLQPRMFFTLTSILSCIEKGGNKAHRAPTYNEALEMFRADSQSLTKAVNSQPNAHSRWSCLARASLAMANANKSDFNTSQAYLQWGEDFYKLALDTASTEQKQQTAEGFARLERRRGNLQMVEQLCTDYQLNRLLLFPHRRAN